jgi:CBS domain-containing protein
MKHGVSQLRSENEKLVGSATEHMLLLDSGDKSIGESNHISAVMNPGVVTVSPQESVERVAQLLAKQLWWSLSCIKAGLCRHRMDRIFCLTSIVHQEKTWYDSQNMTAERVENKLLRHC